MAIDKKKVKVNKDPKISLNALGEYLTVGPSRRKTIIRDQKYQKTFITARYADAEKAIVAFIINGMKDDQLLEDAIDELLSHKAGSEWKEQARENCVDAIGSFLDMHIDIPLRYCSAIQNEVSPPKMMLAGVSVSVRPEIILRDQASNVVGAIKLYFRKTKELSEETGKLISTVLWQYLCDQNGNHNKVRNSSCIVIDIFAGKIHKAPKTFKKALHDVRSACEEIHSRWSTI